MAYRQYVGARYVPLYDGRWDATKDYEPLTIVDDANGNSYTSRKDVPAGTELTNREYWVQTSSFSGAITQLQERMSNAENDIDTIETELTAIESKIDKPVNRSLNAAEILLIVDSFGQNPDGNVITGFQRCIRGTINSVAQGGANFGKFAEIMHDWNGNKESIKSIILCGGSNTLSNPADVSNQLERVAQSAQEYPNASVFVAFMASVYQMPERRQNVQSALSETMKGCDVNGLVFLGNFSEALYPTFITITSDGTHPNGSGGNRIGSAVFNKYANDKMGALIPATVSATDENGITWRFFVTPDGGLYVVVEGTTTAAIGSGSYVNIPIDSYYMELSEPFRSMALPLSNGGAFLLGVKNGRLQYYYVQNASGQGTLPSGTLIMPQASPLLYYGGIQDTTNL